MCFSRFSVAIYSRILTLVVKSCFLIRWLNVFGDFLVGWFIKLSVQTFQSLIFLHRRGNFVYHYWWCTSIYQPLPYPFRSVAVLLCVLIHYGDLILNICHRRQRPNCVKNDPCLFIKMMEMRGEVGKKTPKNERWIIPHFYDVIWIIFNTIWSLSPSLFSARLR